MRLISFRQAVPALVAAALGVVLMRPAASQAANPVFFADPTTQAARWVAANANDSRMPVIRDRIASVPQGRWFTQNDTATVAGEVSSLVGAAAAAGKIPILVLYNIPNRDCGGRAGGGLSNHTAYRAWIDQVADGLQNRPATIILEPDVLAIMTNCLSAAQQAETRVSMAYAGKQLKAASSTARVYFDIGHSAWLPASEAASRLVASDIANSADGISTNVSSTQTTAAEISYAKQVIAATGISRLQAVIDTSRNGNGPLGSEWCDPSGRAIGEPSTSATGDAKIDALLWVKPPGEADGCIAPAGRFVPQRAHDLAVAAGATMPGTASARSGTDGDYYVAPGGSDSSPGTIDRPFASLQKAIDVARPGELVYVRGGVYDITVPAIPSAGVNFWKSGTSDTYRIRYFAYPGEHPVLDFSKLQIQPDPDYTFGVLVTGSYLHLKGFEIRNVPMNTRSNNGVRVSGEAYRDIFELLDIHHIQGAGMFIHTTLGGHLVLNSESHDNNDPRSHQGDGQNADGFGAHYQLSGETTIFRGCRAWWNSDDGWDFISQEVPVIVEQSWSMGNGYIDSGAARSPRGNGAGYKVGSSRTGTRHVVRNNLAWGNRSQGFYANHSTGGNDWFNNTSYNNGIQYDMLGSSWDADGKRTDGVILTGDRVHRLRNNIGFPNSNRNMEGVDSSFNTWDLGLTPSSSDFESISDADFKGPRKADGSLPDLGFLKLRAGSQMIGKGRNVGLPYSGPAPDLGAYER